MKINLVKAGTTYLSNLCAGDVFRTVDDEDRYYVKTDGIYGETPTAVNLETGTLYDFLPDTTRVIFKKATLNVED